ncbi:unnamed protein product [Allacma fusca]|uniref:Uncharacterized protein n=1 Tax=Allacma fusca TaxID=39272 RepID=A0A8J2JYB7_9HEXA|nr:unnamed protein product [Allacma fusca]
MNETILIEDKKGFHNTSMTSTRSRHLSKYLPLDRTIITAILAFCAFSNFVATSSYRIQDSSPGRISDHGPYEIPKTRASRIEKDSDVAYSLEGGKPLRSRRDKGWRRHNPRQNDSAKESHHKSSKTHQSSHHKKLDRIELRKEKELMEDVARLQSESRFYYFNEQLPASRLPNTYDSLLNITDENLHEEHNHRRRNTPSKNESLWKPLQVRTNTAPFHFHMPILTGNSIAESNVDFNEILNEATKYKNPLDFFFLPPIEHGIVENRNRPTISPRLHRTLKPLFDG